MGTLEVSPGTAQEGHPVVGRHHTTGPGGVRKPTRVEWVKRTGRGGCPACRYL